MDFVAKQLRKTFGKAEDQSSCDSHDEPEEETKLVLVLTFTVFIILNEFYVVLYQYSFFYLAVINNVVHNFIND